MKTSLITRALAATAAVGIALIIPATAASAQTLPPINTPVIPPISIGIGGAPIVQTGPTTAAPAPVPNGTVTGPTTATARTTPAAPAVPPVPGTLANALANTQPHATVGNPLPSLLDPLAGIPLLGGAAGAPGLSTLGQPVLADADVKVNACVAAALLTGQPVSGCSSSVSGGSTSLVDALSTVGICARAKVLAGEPVAPCGTATDATGAAGTAPTLTDVAADTNLCLVASILGDTSAPCPTSGTSSSTDPSTIATSLNVCIGAAVLTNTDLTPCTTSTALTDDPTTTPSGADTSTPTDGVNGINGVASGNGSGTPAGHTALDLSTVASGDGNLGTPLGTLPFTGLDAGAAVLAALGLIGSGVAMRRLRAQHHVVNDTRYPSRPQHMS